MRKPFKVTGGLVLASLVGFFVIVAAVNVVMMTFAVKTFGGVETDNAYKAGLAFNRSIADADAQNARHWRVEIVRMPKREADFTVTVRDRNDRPVTGLILAATLVHPTDRRRDKTAQVVSLGAGMFRLEAAAEPGQWDLVTTLRDDSDELFRSRNRIVLERAP
jgi:nitrogen fixation protein FixH